MDLGRKSPGFSPGGSAELEVRAIAGEPMFRHSFRGRQAPFRVVMLRASPSHLNTARATATWLSHLPMTIF